MTLLEVQALDAFYGDFQALFGVTLRVEAGETVALIGANGAGKTTFLKCLVGLIGSRRGEIRFAGEAIAAAPAERISRLGLSLRSEEHTSELQSQSNLVCRLLLEKKQRKSIRN